MQAIPRGTARLSSDLPDSLPAWMTPSQAPRVHWSQRQQQRQEQLQQQPQQQQAPQLPSELAAANDTVDVLEACGSHPQQSQWRRIWELANASYLDRQHRVLWWRLLHGSLMSRLYARLLEHIKYDCTRYLQVVRDHRNCVFTTMSRFAL